MRLGTNETHKRAKTIGEQRERTCLCGIKREQVGKNRTREEEERSADWRVMGAGHGRVLRYRDRYHTTIKLTARQLHADERVRSWMSFGWWR